MRLSRRWKLILAGLVVLGVLEFFELRAENSRACSPGACLLVPGQDSR